MRIDHGRPAATFADVAVRALLTSALAIVFLIA